MARGHKEVTTQVSDPAFLYLDAIQFSPNQSPSRAFSACRLSALWSSAGGFCKGTGHEASRTSMAAGERLSNT